MLGSSVVGFGRLVVGWAVVVAVLVLVAGGGSASATTGHTFAGQFGDLGNGDGEFGEPLVNGPSGVAVMGPTGEVFATDAAQAGRPPEPRVQRFNPAGVFVSSFAIDPSGGGGVSGLAVGPDGVYTAMGANGGVVAVFKYSLAGVKQYALDVGVSGTTINPNTKVAVDPVDGTVYVTATNVVGAQVVASFDPVTGLLTGSFDGSSNSPEGLPFCSQPSGLAVDGVSHQVYVLHTACSGVVRVDRYGADGAYQTTVDVAAPSAVAVDPVSGEVYVAHGGPLGTQVAHLAAGGASVIYVFDAREAKGVRGMAVGGAGAVYISDLTRPFVVRYGRFDGPTVVTGTASSVEARAVVLEGTIDPEGVDSTYHFEYSTDLKFGSRTQESGEVGGSDPIAASGLASGLSPNTIYNFRLVGTNPSGSIAGPTGTFTTGSAPPEPDGALGQSPPFVSAITPRSARLHGTVNPNSNFSSFFRIEYGTTTAYGNTVGALTEGGLPSCFSNCGGDDMPVIGTVLGLEPGTTYHFRVVVAGDLDSSFASPYYGADRTFVTAPAAGAGATGVTTRRATLTGTINPHGEETTYYFNYGSTTSYGARTPEVDGGPGDGDQHVSQTVSGLVPDTTYHVQVVAKGADGVVRSGGDGLFRTAPAPTAAVIGQIGVTTDAATLVGEVNTFGSAGKYHFDVWSLDSSYASATPERSVAGNASAERVSAVLAGLPAGETFVVQLSVTSNDSVGASDLLTFATADVPRVFPVPPERGRAAVYGCGSPQLEAFGGRAEPGEMIAIGGRDLGAGGSVVLGDRSAEPVGWSSSGFKVLIPDDAAGALALTVDCGRRSNTIAVPIREEPDNRFSIVGRSVVGSSASLRVRVPGPGSIASSGVQSRAAKVTVKRAGTATIKVRLSAAGVRTLGRASSRTLKVMVRVRFTPAGGRTASRTTTVTFKRRAR